MDMFYVKLYLRKDSEGKNNVHIQRERNKDDKGSSVYKYLQQNEITYFYAFKNPAINRSTRDEWGWHPQDIFFITYTRGQSNESTDLRSIFHVEQSKIIEQSN